METVELKDFLDSQYRDLLAGPADRFTAYVDLFSGLVRNGEHTLAHVISRHKPQSTQLDVRVRAINGCIYKASIKRRPGNAPSRATFRLYKQLDIPPQP